MIKDDFKNRADLKHKKKKSDGARTGQNKPIRSVPPGPSAPAPKPFFSGPVMPIAAKVRTMPFIIEAERKEAALLLQRNKSDE